MANWEFKLGQKIKNGQILKQEHTHTTTKPFGTDDCDSNQSTSGLSYLMELSVLWSESWFSVSSFTRPSFFLSVCPSTSYTQTRTWTSSWTQLKASIYVLISSYQHSMSFDSSCGVHSLWLLEFFPHVNSSSGGLQTQALLLLILEDPFSVLWMLACLATVYVWMTYKERR